MGSDENHFNVSLIVRDKVTRQCPQTTTFEEKEGKKSGFESRSLCLPAYRLTARQNRLSSCSENHGSIYIGPWQKPRISRWQEGRKRSLPCNPQTLVEFLKARNAAESLPFSFSNKAKYRNQSWLENEPNQLRTIFFFFFFFLFFFCILLQCTGCALN